MLAVRRISKTYLPPPAWLRPLVRAAVTEPTPALRDISFEAAAGEVVGVIGPNGAGKTTLLKIISTLLEPTDGTVEVAGHDTVRSPHEVCRRLGLVLEGDQGLYDRLTGVQNLSFYGVLAGMPRPAALRRAHELMDLMDLADRDKLVFGYSAGMRMRLSIARALMADPPLLVLDEPTRSLDPLASRLISRLVVDLAEQGRAVLVTNHRLDEVVGTCDRVVAIVHGQVRYCGAPDGLASDTTGAAAALSDLLEREDQRP